MKLSRVLFGIALSASTSATAGGLLLPGAGAVSTARAGVCAPGGCVLGLRVNVVWQVEFTADAVVVF